ncbi:MAG: hypothetical protein ACJ71S_06655 [Acidobacteriaceae bacterium]|jgi:hypothetical protein
MLVSYGAHGPFTMEQMMALFRWASEQPDASWKPLPAPERHVLARPAGFDAMGPWKDDSIALVWGPVADIIQCSGVAFDAWMDIPDAQD